MLLEFRSLAEALLALGACDVLCGLIWRCIHGINLSHCRVEQHGRQIIVHIVNSSVLGMYSKVSNTEQLMPYINSENYADTSDPADTQGAHLQVRSL